MKNKISATFIQGSNDVTCTSEIIGYPSYWLIQLHPGDYINPYGVTKKYSILTVNSNSNLTLTSPFDGSTVSGPFVMTSSYPLYDDDGFTGAKAVSLQTDSFGLVSGDIFNLRIDGSTDQTYVFTDSSNPFMFYYDANTVAQLLNSSFSGLKATVEWVTDPSSSFGYSDAFILRTDGTHNKIIFENGAAISKLGFVPDSTVYGNNDVSSSGSEYISIVEEFNNLTNELGMLTYYLGLPEKLDRTSIFSFIATAQAEVQELNNEINSLNTEMNSLSVLLQEPSFASYRLDKTALVNAAQFLIDSSSILPYSEYLADFTNETYWVLDYTGSQQQIFYPNPGDTTLVLRVDSANDKRILNHAGFDLPITVTYLDNDATITGAWTGFDSSGVSLRNPPYDSSVTFSVNVIAPPIYLNTNGPPPYTNLQYHIDSTGFWMGDTAGPHFSPNPFLFSYADYPTIGQLKTALDSTINQHIPILVVTGDATFNSYSTGNLLQTTSDATYIRNDATIYFAALRDCKVTYSTISDRNLTDRSSFILDSSRLDMLTNRMAEIDLRETQIRAAILNEQYLMTSDGSSGAIYEWANNRFNRSNGSEARLMQIKKQIEVNNSSLGISKNFI